MRATGTVATRRNGEASELQNAVRKASRGKPSQQCSLLYTHECDDHTEVLRHSSAHPPFCSTARYASPTMASPITRPASGLKVPDDPILPFIEGDGTGPDIWRASVRVFDAAIDKAYGGKRRVEWKEVLAGEKAFNQ